jgi:hypothetical protein
MSDTATAVYHGVPIPDNIAELDQVRVEAVKEVARLIDIGGLSQAAALREVAPSLGITTRQLHRWAATHGMPLPSPGTNLGTQRMAAAAREYAQQQRLELSNRLMDTVEETVRRIEQALMEDPEFFPDAREMKDLTTSFAILTDKRRLEDGDPTSRHEIQSDTARAEILKRLTKLAERREEVGDIVIEGTVVGELPEGNKDEEE